MDTLSSVRTYFTALSSLASAPIPEWKGTPEESAVYSQLEGAGLVTIRAKALKGALYELQITPSGAMALAQWGELLDQRTLKRRILDNSGRLFWLALGVGLDRVLAWL